MTILENMENNDIYASVKNTLKDRFGSSMYGTFVIAWCLWNWEAIYVTLFVDQNFIFNTFHQFKIDYLWNTYYDGWGIHTWWKTLIAPLISVFVAIWGLSYFDFICFRKTCSNKYKQERERIKQEKEVETDKKEVLKVKESNLIKENEIKKEMTQEEIWEEEYKKLEQKDGFMDTMEDLKKCIYEYNGILSVDPWKGDSGFYMPISRTAFLEANNIVEKDEGKIILTQKGKLFLRKFFEEENSKI